METGPVSLYMSDLYLTHCVSDCKVLFKHEMTSRCKDLPWRSCSYCSSLGQKMLHSHYGGKMEEFCKPHCMSQYTVLYYGVKKIVLPARSKLYAVAPSRVQCGCVFVLPSYLSLSLPFSSLLLPRWVDVTVVGNRAT